MAQKRQPKYRKFIGFAYVGIAAVLIYTLVINGVRVFQQRQQLAQLQEKKTELLEEKEALAKEVELLNDDEYVARYARDHWIFSGEGEEVVKLPDSKK
jgi:Septum formation initiator